MIPIISLLCILVVLSGTPIHIIITSDLEISFRRSMICLHPYSSGIMEN